MLTITASAWERLSHLKSTRPDVAFFRLTRNDGRVACRCGVQKDHDQVIVHPGRPTLLLFPAVAEELSDSVLDALETETGPRRRRHNRDDFTPGVSSN